MKRGQGNTGMSRVHPAGDADLRLSVHAWLSRGGADGRAGPRSPPLQRLTEGCTMSTGDARQEPSHRPSREQVRGRNRARPLAVTGVLTLAALAAGLITAPLADAAGARLPHLRFGGGTATFTYTGAEQTFTVPAGTSSVSITAIGAAGGAGQDSTSSGGAGGQGRSVTGIASVSPGETLYVEVGGVGFAGSIGGSGGFNGGADGSSYHSIRGGGGGGASDVRTISGTLGSRLVVAGGGGGGGGSSSGCTGNGGAGGNAGAAGSAAATVTGCGSITGGGGGEAGTGVGGGTDAPGHGWLLRNRGQPGHQWLRRGRWQHRRRRWRRRLLRRRWRRSGNRRNRPHLRWRRWRRWFQPGHDRQRGGQQRRVGDDHVHVVGAGRPAPVAAGQPAAPWRVLPGGHGRVRHLGHQQRRGSSQPTHDRDAARARWAEHHPGRQGPWMGVP